MSIPHAVFLDTSIFAGQQYNFSSTTIDSFLKAAKDKDIQLLIPAPTLSEIERQMKTRANEAFKSLSDAIRKAPFLKKWKQWPEKPSGILGDWELQKIVFQEWNDFLSHFKIYKLNYDGIDINKIMNQYNLIKPPFGEGKKRKEFPDAFAFESLSLYAHKNRISIAIISCDSDFKAACEQSTSLIYYPSLPAFTELLLGTDKIISKYKLMLENDNDKTIEAICDESSQIDFYPNDQDVEIEYSDAFSVNSFDSKIVAIGEKEFTILFQSDIEFKHSMSWEEEDGWDEDQHVVHTHTEQDYTRELSRIDGTAKIILAPDHEGISSIGCINFDTDAIEVEAPYIPQHRYR
jgi:hypothetical protein